MPSLSQKLPPTLRLIIIGFVSILPVLIFGFPFFSHDGTPHAVWYSNFSRQLWAGEIYPRWLSQMNGGLGSPAMFYYPPAGYYLASPFRILLSNDSHGWYQLGWSACVAQIASGLCAYLWLKQIAARRAAFIAAALYLLMPYHLAFDLYRRGAFAEFWTFVWMPLILYFVHAVARGSKTTSAFLGLAVTYALLVTTHLPVTLMFSVVPVVYAFHFAADRSRYRGTFFTVAAMILGIGLSAVYLLPALTMQRFVQFQNMTAGLYYFGNWFLITRLKPWGSESGYFWMVFSATALAACAYRVCRAEADERLRREAVFWFAVIFACLIMMTPVSYPLWHFVTPLQKLQFPWRFNTVTCIALAALTALALTTVERGLYVPGRKMRALACVIFVFWISYTVAQALRAYPATRANPAVVLKDTDDINRIIKLGKDTAEYRPKWATSLAEEESPQRVLYSEKDLRKLLEKIGTTGGELTKAVFTNDAGGSLTVTEWKPGEIRLRVETARDAQVRVSQFYYPGWQANLITNLNESGELLKLEPSTPDGLIDIGIPAGTHQISLKLERTPAERYGRLISLASVFIALSIAMSIAISSLVKSRARRRIIE